MGKPKLGTDITKWVILKVEDGWAVTPPLKLEDGTPLPVWLLEGHTYPTYSEACEAFAERLPAFRRVIAGG